MSDPADAPAADEPAVDASCELCGKPLGVPVNYLNDKQACAACVAQVQADLVAEIAPANTYPLSFFGALAGALLGAGVWAGIAIATDFEVGYIAVLVGFLSGYGAKLAASWKKGHGLQILAAAVSLIGLVAAKYFIASYYVVKAAHNQGAEISYLDPEVMKAFLEVLPRMLSPFDALWAILAIGAAYRVPAPTKVSIHTS